MGRKLIEFFGLSKAGKSHYRENFLKKFPQVKNYKAEITVPNRIKLFYFSKYLIKHPINTTMFFAKLNTNHLTYDPRVISMRNSFLLGVLAKKELLNKIEGDVMIEDYTIQSIFMIFQKRAKKKEIEFVLKKLYDFDLLFLFDVDEKTRMQRLERTKFITLKNLKKKYLTVWMANSRYNYELVKKILDSRFKTDLTLLKKYSRGGKKNSLKAVYRDYKSS